ncbi:MAG: SDR family NAD(P)-dependent oxidoreductase [Saprospiraceae bacterium]|nr:SDR family NAD(P)-dependent oxidoreductase [Saprospiraceae bacterium]
MEGKVVLVTGATNGIGKQAATEIAKAGATVVLVGRSAEKTEATVKEIQAVCGHSRVDSILADLSVMSEIRRLAETFLARYDRLDVLLNNAGAIYEERKLTVDGYEMTMALNHLSYFLLTNLLLERLKQTAQTYGEARVINVSSGAHAVARKGIAFEDIHATKAYSAMGRYGESKLMNVYWEAQNRYRQYVWKNNPELSWVLDPVITVHPDGLFFECFSKDESTYGKLTCNYEVFRQIETFRCGTTNVDYSTKLYNEFQKIRTYKETELKVDPSGFEVQTAEDEAWKEVKIDLPDTWVRGFLQVSSAMTMPAVRFDLHPTDVYNICLKLRRHKETEGPRSLRWMLTPGEPIRLVFEPWNLTLVCPRSIFKGSKNHDIRLWGRRRLLMLERLIPVAQGFTVTLLGSGMPSFFEAHLGDMSFTLGLSGWTANDWSRAGNFDLLAPRAEVDTLTKQRVFDALRDNWLEDTGSLAQRLDLDRDIVAGALSAYVQAGRVIYDLSKQVWRVRELTRDPLAPEALRFANPREEAAAKMVEAGLVSETNVEPAGKGTKITALVQDKKRSHRPELHIDGDERLVKAVCDCSFHQANQLRQGPCEHILAARMAAKR